MAPSALLHLRYRPASDVLSGRVELDTADVAEHVVEALDADTTVEWRRAEQGQPDTLAGFQLVHATEVLRSDVAAALPVPVLALARQLVQSGAGALRAGASSLERVHARAESRAALVLADLARPTWRAVSTRRAPADDARKVSTALHHLATTIDHLPGPDELGRRFHLVGLLRELGSLLGATDAATAGLTAGGTAAAARTAVRGGLPLTSGERARLRLALISLDDPTTWPAAHQILTELTASLSTTSHSTLPHPG